MKDVVFVTVFSRPRNRMPKQAARVKDPLAVGESLYSVRSQRVRGAVLPFLEPPFSDFRKFSVFLDVGADFSRDS